MGSLVLVQLGLVLIYQLNSSGWCWLNRYHNNLDYFQVLSV